MIEGSHFWVMFQTGYGGHIEGPAQKFRASFADGIISVGLAGLIDFGEVADITYGLSGGGEVSAIGSQVGEDGSYGFFSYSWDSQEVFSGKGVFGFFGGEEFIDFFFEFGDGF